MPNKMAVVNPSKALVALVAMVCITVLMALERIAAEAATGMVGAIVGYAIGNGIAAAIDPNAYVMDDGRIGTTTELG
jgi:formylmethanofuran:tetrahydromethanopterin formyltransferase